MLQVTVRDATPEDIPAILEIYNDAVLHLTATADYEPQSLAKRVAWYEERRSGDYAVVVAANEGGEVVGWASLNPYHSKPGYRFTVENSVYVAASHRGRGVGKALLGALIERARTAGYHSILARIDGDNAASVAVHEAFGFRHAGHLHEVYCKFDRWLDVVYMELLLQQAGQG